MVTVFRFRRSSELVNNIILRSNITYCIKIYFTILCLWNIVVNSWDPVACEQINYKVKYDFFRRVVDELELRNWFE